MTRTLYSDGQYRVTYDGNFFELFYGDAHFSKFKPKTYRNGYWYASQFNKIVAKWLDDSAFRGPAPRARVLVLGFGLGAVPLRLLQQHGLSQIARVVAVEKDRAPIRLFKRGVDDGRWAMPERLHIVHADGAQFLREKGRGVLSPRRFDIIFDDMFAERKDLGYDVRDAHNLLRPHGLFVANVHTESDKAYIVRQIRASFGVRAHVRVLRDNAPGGSGNILVLAAKPGRAHAVPRGVPALRGGARERGALWSFPAPKTMYVIGDVHGDIVLLNACLQLCGVLAQDCQPPNFRWKKGCTDVVVQLGDQLDSSRSGTFAKSGFQGDGDIKLFRAMNALRLQAAEEGGAVHMLVGNHELMNTQGDHGYTSHGDAVAAARDRTTPSTLRGQPRAARRALLTPGSAFCKEMAATRAAVLRVGDVVFVHGALNRKTMHYFTPDEINRTLATYLRNGPAALSANQRGIFAHALDSPEGILWKRFFNRYGHCIGSPEATTTKCCREAAPFLGWRGKEAAWFGLDKKGRKVDLRRAAYGHTPQSEINSQCGGAILLADAGMSGSFHDGERTGAAKRALRTRARARVFKITRYGGQVEVLGAVGNARAGIPADRATRPIEHRSGTFESRRRRKRPPNTIINPSTGRWVKRSGRVGQKLVRMREVHTNMRQYEKVRDLWDWWARIPDSVREKDVGWWDTRLNDQIYREYPAYIMSYRDVLEKAKRFFS